MSEVNSMCNILRMDININSFRALLRISPSLYSINTLQTKDSPSLLCPRFRAEMEGVLEASWNSFNAAMQVEESELMAQLLGTYPVPSEQDYDPSFGIPSVFWSDLVADSNYSSQDVNSSLCYWPQENGTNISVSTGCIYAPPDYQTYYMSESNVVPAINNIPQQMVSCMAEEAMVVSTNSFGDQVCLNEETSIDDLGDSSMNPPKPVVLDQKTRPKRKFQSGEFDKPTEEDHKPEIAAESLKKKARGTSQVQRNAKNPKSKKTQKNISSGDEEESNAAALNGQSSSCYSSDDNSNASQELNGGGSTSSSSKGPAAFNLNGKTRAGRGSATDPQSLYARKRRERINERLRILQNLVPSGTKVDISTMLEEAVQYVKFLQLQIKLLSSDELWMYAPLAYNGMDIGLDLKISPLQQ